MTDDHKARPGPGQRRPWIPDVLAGRYEIDRELGAGAAAVTVSALDQRLGRRVAIKILKPEADRDQDFTSRFSREARAAASISHPNVVSVYDVGEEGDLLYLVMQFVDGSDLKRLIQRAGAMPWRRAVEIAREVLAGLAPLHEAGIVHRDIKPQNVLIGKAGEVKVTDFGVAHIERDTSLTAAGTTVGTAAYMAPEQAQGQAPTPAADVYAVGVMLYEMVTGKVPFDEATSMATMLAHIQQTAAPPMAPTGLERIPDGVVQVIRQAMAKDPRSRFRSAAAMGHALEHPEWRAPAPNGARSAGRTEVVPSLQRRQARPAPVRVPSAASTPSRPASRPIERSGGGFGTTVVMILVALALGLAAVAAGLWALENQDRLFGGGDDPPATATVVGPTETPIGEVPAVIDPAGDPPTQTPIPPTPTLTPTPTPTAPPPTETPVPPTIQVIEPVNPTVPPATEPSTDQGSEQIIEPIEGSTVVPDPQG